MTKGDVFRFIILVGIVAGVAAAAWPDIRSGNVWKVWLTPQTVLSAAGIVIGFLIVSWQLKRQHWNTLDNNRRQSQDRLKVEIYAKVAERIEATSIPLHKVSMLPTAFVGELSLRHAALHSGAAGAVPNSTVFPELVKAHQSADESLTALVSLLETYAIAFSDHPDFGPRISQDLHTLNVCTNDFHQAASQFAGSSTSSAVTWPASAADVQILTDLAQSVQRAASSAATTVSALRVVGQNYLLGALFPGHRV